MSNSIEWEGHTGQCCIYRSKNHVSFIQVNSTDVFAPLRCFQITVIHHSLWDCRQGKELVHLLKENLLVSLNFIVGLFFSSLRLLLMFL